VVAWSPDPRCHVVAWSPDHATCSTAGLQLVRETFGQDSGTVGRPCHNRCRETVSQQLQGEHATTVRECHSRSLSSSGARELVMLLRCVFAVFWLCWMPALVFAQGEDA